MICSLSLLFAITSCGDAKPTGERLPDSEVSDEDIVDITPETSDEESVDEETSDETTEDVENDDPDTTPEYDDEDVENDDADTMPEYDDLDIELPECSASSETPCYDSSSGLIWSAISSKMTWENAVDYCLNYSESGLSGWHMPTIGKLRTLIKDCSGSVIGGSCGLVDSCVTIVCDDDCYSCDYYEDGRYSKFGDTGSLWSFSNVVIPGEVDGGIVWYVNFNSGGIYGHLLDDATTFVRCVR